MKKFKLAIYTSTRAEYGVQRPLLKALEADPFFELNILISGTHLDEKSGATKHEILSDKYINTFDIPIDLSDLSDVGITKAVGETYSPLAKYFQEEKPQALIVTGDRYEIIAPVMSALLMRIPVCHLYGGELTEGAIDDRIRHAVTKLSDLHFTSCEAYRQRIIQMGEQPSTVHNVGALFVDNLLNPSNLIHEELELELGVKVDKNLCLVTYHPETNRQDKTLVDLENLLSVLSETKDLNFLITGPNADQSGDHFRELIVQNCQDYEHLHFFESLGMRRYLYLLNNVKAVIGNSSSGIIEAPFFKIPTLNIGERQRGRLMTESIINVGHSIEDIKNGMCKIKNKQFLKKISNQKYPFGSGGTTEKILDILKKQEFVSLNKKVFYHV